MAAGNGVVLLAGRSGGLGNAVRIRHPNGYETIYGHLSRIFVRQGDHVSQGERIGAVGQTGLATGPHLDYRMVSRGVYLNPLRVVLPSAEPIPDTERARFDAVARERMALLDGASAGAAASHIAAR